MFNKEKDNRYQIIRKKKKNLKINSKNKLWNNKENLELLVKAIEINMKCQKDRFIQFKLIGKIIVIKNQRLQLLMNP